MNEDQRWQYFHQIRALVPDKMDLISKLPFEKCVSARFLENEFIPQLGLNNEMLSEQPIELSPYFGKGLHLWQYPNQLSHYLAWLAVNATEVRCYAEIGCRWGGTFILISEWIRKFSRNLCKILAVDPIGQTPLVEEYFNQLRNRCNVEPIFIKDFSTSGSFHSVMKNIKPDFVFIDGDHSLQGALLDHLLAREYAHIIVHHDIFSQVCPGTTLLWNALKKLELDKFATVEFTQQYPSVYGHFLGIGVMKRLHTQS